jgi:hypothetical protein
VIRWHRAERLRAEPDGQFGDARPIESSCWRTECSSGDLSLWDRCRAAVASGDGSR